MKIRLTQILAAVVGLILLAGYFIQNPILTSIRLWLLGLIITLAGVAGLIGIVNLISVHAAKVKAEKRDWGNSLILIIAFAGIFVAGMIMKPDHPFFTSMVSAVVVPVEASLLALLSVTLAVALIRAIRPGINLLSIIFIASAILFIWAGTGFIPFQDQRFIQHVLSFLNTLPLGGARGILIGVGLGSLTVGVRTLLKQNPGHAVEMSELFCPNCGKENPDGALICQFCDSPLVTFQPRDPNDSSPLSAEPILPVEPFRMFQTGSKASAG